MSMRASRSYRCSAPRGRAESWQGLSAGSEAGTWAERSNPSSRQVLALLAQEVQDFFKEDESKKPPSPRLRPIPMAIPPKVRPKPESMKELPVSLTTQ